MKIRIRPHDASVPQDTEWHQTHGWLAALRDDDGGLADPADDGHAQPSGGGNARPEVRAEVVARAQAAPRAAITVRSAPSERAVIGDELRIPIIWCEMRSCISWHADPEAIGEADNRARAVRAGWRVDALGRMACPRCQQTDAGFWATAPVVRWNQSMAVTRTSAVPGSGTATPWFTRRQEPAGPRPYRCPFCLCPEVEPATTATFLPHWPGSLASRWLMPAVQMAGLVCGCWRSSPDPALTGRPCVPAIATRTLRAEAASVHAVRDFTLAAVRRQGMRHNSEDVAVVVSELVTNALRHGVPEPGDPGFGGRIGFGLLQHGRWLLCAVADPGRAVPVPWAPDVLAETGRGLQMVNALSARWGYTSPSENGKVVWAVFASRLALPAAGLVPRQAAQRPGSGDRAQRRAEIEV